MNELLARIIDAHGGVDLWNRSKTGETTIVSGGGLSRSGTSQRLVCRPPNGHAIYFPGAIETHSGIQDVFFGEDLIHLPTRRRAYTRGSDRRPIPEMLMVSIDISEVQFE